APCPFSVPLLFEPFLVPLEFVHRLIRHRVDLSQLLPPCHGHDTGDHRPYHPDDEEGEPGGHQLGQSPAEGQAENQGGDPAGHASSSHQLGTLAGLFQVLHHLDASELEVIVEQGAHLARQPADQITQRLVWLLDRIGPLAPQSSMVPVAFPGHTRPPGTGRVVGAGVDEGNPAPTGSRPRPLSVKSTSRDGSPGEPSAMASLTLSMSADLSQRPRTIPTPIPAAMNFPGRRRAKFSTSRMIPSIPSCSRWSARLWRRRAPSRA